MLDWDPPPYPIHTIVLLQMPQAARWTYLDVVGKLEYDVPLIVSIHYDL